MPLIHLYRDDWYAYAISPTPTSERLVADLTIDEAEWVEDTLRQWAVVQDFLSHAVGQ